ncbi:MAG: ribose 5-phosphate isomerase A [Candidatus Altiarchaeales archaeon ex4484_43]|nr:MAG: ribose 5-phosphate isomerase A [Candidatus Altiarchaeales archaeon ex4484_43]
MIIGLGTGSTAEYAIKKIAEKNLNIVAIPTSRGTEKLAEKLRIPLAKMNEYGEIDMDIDGADEVDPEFNLIKGGGGAHTREKRIAERSKKFIVIVDSGGYRERDLLKEKTRDHHCGLWYGGKDTKKKK